MEFLEYLVGQLKNWSLTFAFFVGGAVFGLIAFFIAYAAISHAKVKPIKATEELNIDDITQKSIENFVAAHTGNDFKRKINLLAETAADSAEEIFHRYFGDDYKGYEVMPEGGYLKNGLKIPLVFTAYEGLAFVERIADDLQSSFEGVLDAFGIKLIYPFVRKYIGTDAKTPKDLRIADVFAAIYRNSGETEEKKSGAIKRFFAARVSDVAMGVAAKYTDRAFIEALGKVLISIGLLCSRSLCVPADEEPIPEENAV